MNYIAQSPPRRFIYRTPEEQLQDLEQLRLNAEASWSGITELQLRRKLRDLDGHPMRPILGRMLATALRRHAPQLLPHLPPEFLEPTP